MAHRMAAVLALAMIMFSSDALASPKIGGVAQVGNSPSPGTRYVFLYLQYFDGAKPHAAYAVYHKPGLATSPDPYQKLAIVRATSHVPTIAAFMQRAAEAGFDNASLEMLLNDMLPPGSYATLAEKVSAFVLGGTPGSLGFQQKQALLKTHPQPALALGQAYLARVPDSGPNTFELRVVDPATLIEGPVVTRVTSPAGPTLLPPPGGLSEKLETSPRGHLRVHLRWCLPQPLREMAFHWSGFKVFRVPRQSWVNVFGADPPLNMTTAMLLNAIAQNPALATPVNRFPISPGVELPCPPPAAGDDFFMTDDNDSAPQPAFSIGGQSFSDGWEATYFVAALDHFGRVGELSPGLPVKICDRLPPLAPSRVRVDNIYRQEGALDHALRISWQRDDAAEVRRYHVFRYLNPDDVFVDRQSPLWPATPNRIAMVNNPGQGQRVSLTDNTPGALSLPADDGRTRWFVVVAEDHTSCPNAAGHGNLSGPSGAVPGALYDLAGPGAPQGRLRVPCCEVSVTQDRIGPVNPQDPVRLVARREHTRIAWVEFRDVPSGTFLGRFYFENQMERVARPPFQGAAIFQARFGAVFGASSEWVGAQTMGGAPYPEHRWTGRWPCAPAPGCPGGIVDPVDPDTGQLNGVCVDLIHPPAEVVEAALYRRVGDTGPLVLMSRQKLDANGDGVNDLAALCETAPVLVPGRVCYFLQYFDRNGNPSVVAQIDCAQSHGTEGFPMPRITHFVPPEIDVPLLPTAGVTLAWFCPRAGVDRFEVAVTPPPSGVTTTFQEGNEAGVGQLWGVVDSERLAAGFGGNAPNFAITVILERGKMYRAKVRAVGEGTYGSRATGAWSDPARITWLDDPGSGGLPQDDCPVPWPARHVAPLITDPARELEARRVDWEDVVPGLGPRPTTEIWIKVGCFGSGQVTGVSQPGSSGLVPPRVNLHDLNLILEVPLAFTVYLHQTAAASRGTMLQVSHYVDEILATSPAPGQLDIIDRAFAVRNFSNADPIPPPCLWFRVRQPLMAGRTYRCAVVLHGGDREPIEVLRTGEISVLPLP